MKFEILIEVKEKKTSLNIVNKRKLNGKKESETSNLD